MKSFLKILIPMSLIAMSGCVVAPYGYGYHHGYYGPRVVYGPPVVYGPRVVVAAPAPAVVVRAYPGYPYP